MGAPGNLTYELHGMVAVVAMDDGKANVLGHDTLDALQGALDRAEAEASAFLLVGRPGRFSAGFDLSVMTAGEEPMRALVIAGAEFLARLLVFPMPVVAACTGHAVAAGSLMLLAADERIGAEGDFKIGLNEIAIGMPLPHFVIEMARYRMPPSAFDRILLGQVLSPPAAMAAGFLDRAVPAETVTTEATAAATALAELRTGAVRRSKRLARGETAARILATLHDDLATLTGPQHD